MKIRVWVTEVWDNLHMEFAGDQTFGQVKGEALQRALDGGGVPDDYEVKFRGALIRDENQTLEAAGVPDGAPIIILHSARRPVT